MKLKKLHTLIIAGIMATTACTDEDDPTTPVDDPRADFIGLWSVKENSQIFGESVYDSEIIRNSSIDENIAIDNFYQLGEEVVIQARVDGNQLEIYRQVTSTNQSIEGSGVLIDKNTLEINFTSDDGAAVDSVSSTYTRK